MFLMVDGRKYLKATIVMIMLTAKQVQKVIMQTLCTQGVTIKDLHGTNHMCLNLDDATGSSTIKSRDITATLVQIGSSVCLTVVKVVEFTIKGKKASSRCTAVELVELEQQSSRIKVLIQVLKLRCASEATSDAAADVAWLWKYTYVQLESPSTTT